MNSQPMKSHSIASRCICAKCGKVPAVSARGEDPISITATCHGQSETKTVSKKELVFTQRFFDDGEDSESIENDLVDRDEE